MKRIFIVLLALFCFSLAAQSNASALVYSLSNDWSNISNPNGPWSLNEGINPLLHNVAGWPLGEFGSSQTAWADTGDLYGFLPGWFKSVADPNVVGSYSGHYDWLPGDVITHTTDAWGMGHGYSNVTWTSPETSIYDVSGGVWLARNLGRSNDWFIYLDNQLLTSGSIYDGDPYSRANPDSFNFEDLNISKGSVLKLEFVKTNSGGEFCGVNLNINAHPVPEPATMFLFAPAILGVFFRKRQA